MKRAFSMVIASCVLASVASAQRAASPDTMAPGVRLPIGYAFETGLFGATHASSADTLLMTLRRPSPRDLFMAARDDGLPRIYEQRCFEARRFTPSGERAQGLATDSVTAGETRTYRVVCSSPFDRTRWGR